MAHGPKYLLLRGDSTAFKTGGLRAHVTSLNANNVSNDVLAFNIPAGSRIAVLQHLGWSTTAYIDIYGVAANTYVEYIMRADTHNGANHATRSNVYDGARIVTSASDLTSFAGGRIQIHVRKGIFQFMDIAFYGSMLPCNKTSFTHSDNIYIEIQQAFRMQGSKQN